MHDGASIYDELGRCVIRFNLHDVHGLLELLHLEDTLLVGLDALLESSKRVRGVPYLLLKNRWLNKRLRLGYDLWWIRLGVMVSVRNGGCDDDGGRRGFLERSL